MAIVQTRRGQPGAVTVSVSSPGLQSATVPVEAASATLPPIVD